MENICNQMFDKIITSINKPEFKNAKILVIHLENESPPEGRRFLSKL